MYSLVGRFGVYTDQLCPSVWCALRATCFRPLGGQFLVDRITCRVKLMQLRVAAADPVSQSVSQSAAPRTQWTHIFHNIWLNRCNDSSTIDRLGLFPCSMTIFVDQVKLVGQINK
ncbi:hypothetical protein T01_12742 [Trichinella spiralis]|uniref:Uncharacterized protein n=1 Tax=Trichinella spiralis TaxID=6334 RepID=A0A0V1BW86_TRISP|nr:hypothetical protein T01_12742 [Trichinella spiralis]